MPQGLSFLVARLGGCLPWLLGVPNDRSQGSTALGSDISSSPKEVMWPLGDLMPATSTERRFLIDRTGQGILILESRGEIQQTGLYTSCLATSNLDR
jgi:hypothetical protein